MGAAADPRRTVLVWRGDDIESVHELAAVVTGPDGRVLAEVSPGDGAVAVFARSAAKPLQALAALGAGVPERLGLTDAHVAVACASHTSTDRHVGLVGEILAAAGLDESALQCGVVAPLDPTVALALARRGETPRPIHHNCSGNHALGLALAATSGADPATYLAPDHPVQVAMRAALADAARPGGLVGEASDGCGMRAYRLPLAALASAYGRLASGGLGDAGRRAADAMRADPDLVYGRGGIDTELMRAEQTAGLVAKVGAEGVIAVGLADGRGLAVKIGDGARRAIDPAAVAAVRAGLGLTAAGEALNALAAPELRTARGGPAGRVSCALGFGGRS